MQPRRSRSVCPQLLSAIVLSWGVAVAQMNAETERLLRTVVQNVVTDSAFQFVDPSTGRRFKVASDAAKGTQLKLSSPYNDWRYWNGVLNIALLRVGEALNEATYVDFVRKNIAFSFDNYKWFEDGYKGEGKWNVPFGELFVLEELDDCGAMGASVVEVYRRDREERYRPYLDQVADHMMKKQSRLDDGTFVRAFPHKWTLWADDLYMSVSFLSRLAELTGDSRYFDDAALQVVNFHKYAFDSTAGLMHHCWYSDVQRPGVAFWGRANGWAMLAQVDLLDRLPADYPKRLQLLEILRRDILGIARYQSAEGLWHQLLDKTDSYLETSCSAMFTYVIARSVNKGYIEPRYGSIARAGWRGVMSRIRADGMIEEVCVGTGISDDLVAYYHRPTPLNDPHGIGAVLLAGSELLQLKKE